MSITSLDGLVAGMVQGKMYPIQKASMSNTVAGHYTALWRATGFPAQGAIPSTAAVCNASHLGALPLPAKIAGQDRVIAQLQIMMSAVGHTLVLEDRLMHMGGLNGTLATAQVANVSLHSNLAVNNLAERIGEVNYSEVQWFLEWYADTGATGVTPTVQCTFGDDTTGSVNVDVLGGTAILGNTRAGRRYRINPTNGRYIRSVETVTLSASTLTAGSFGVTATRPRAVATCIIANQLNVIDWSMLGSPNIPDQSCLSLSMQTITTSSGALQGNILLAVG